MNNLRYKTFDQLMASVKSDLSKYADNNLINDALAIKTARFCNSDLGIKLNGVSEAVIDIHNYEANLPKNFLSGISAYMIFQEAGGFLSPGLHGTHTRQYTREELMEKNIPITTAGCVSTCGGCTWVVREYNQKQMVYDRILPVFLTNNASGRFCSDAPSRVFNSDKREYQVDIKNEKIYTNIKEGTLYMSYIADMVDDDGNLLVLDHDITNPYYEWAIKAKLLEDMVYNKDAPVQELMQDARANARIARGEAISIVIRPEYREKNAYTLNKIRQFYNVNVKMFV
jgi:hypothetical protein